MSLLIRDGVPVSWTLASPAHPNRPGYLYCPPVSTHCCDANTASTSSVLAHGLNSVLKSYLFLLFFFSSSYYFFFFTFCDIANIYCNVYYVDFVWQTNHNVLLKCKKGGNFHGCQYFFLQVETSKLWSAKEMSQLGFFALESE